MTSDPAGTVPWLTLLWLLPLVGAAAVVALPARAHTAAKSLALAVSLAVAAVAVALAFLFDVGGAHYQFVESHSWIPAFGIRYALGLDGIALVLVVLTAVLVPLLLLAGWNDTRGDADRPRATHRYVALFLVVEAMVIVAFAALDIVLFYIFFEAMLVPMYFLVAGFGPRAAASPRARAAVKFLLYNLFGGLVMLAAVIGLYVVTAGDGSPFESGTFDVRAIAAAVSDGSLAISAPVANALFLGFMVAFAIKAPLWPLHTWLPGTAAQATPSAAVLMMAIVDKVGTFAMLRYCLQLFPEASATFAPLIVVLAVVSILYGALVAIAQTDIMRLVAYASISHFGFIVLGIFVFTNQGGAGSTLYMVNHGIATAALMLVAGFLVTQRGTRAIADYGGIGKVAPVLAGTFLIAGLATLSLPGLGPFVGEFLVLIGTYTRHPWAAVAAVLALVLAAVYVLWTYQRMMTGPVRGGNEGVRDLRPRELLVVAPLVLALLGLGLYPKPVLDAVNPAVERTVSRIEGGDPAPTVDRTAATEGEGP
ncbi:NADH-quinone oxidoreductase subunit M [Rhodococcus rhodnii]|uniref:NADH dehydrogenase subunit M n=2 Tax=Rhodococcus rhodnii TaxID=38312 RepID=R7WK70_9NOCA|nr:NADH-quinone oxidoreductase subunit M [Rhodococcus rhodnii]EOM75716.1 NADH dehydrogenase subunit M [Rhodococcus rhodnii LMG 5362]TXG89644.1 NADH-quinone oxidoreductase subunit M [Rhodococcus rhodnii]